MTPALVSGNIAAYALQIGLLVGLGALVPAILRIRTPRARLLFWQVLLVACLALPWVRTWRQEVVAGTIQMSAQVTAAVAPVPSALARKTIPLAPIALWFLAAGMVIRLGWLCTGLARLAAYRRRGQILPPELRIGGTMAGATLMLSDDIASPVTFGWRDPAILLPANFPSLDGAMRDAIVCHELLHVERRDWLFTLAEELVRALLWFHPAIWWVIGEIQLAREQTVDQAVIELTQARGPYVDALLLMAGASVPGDASRSQLDLAPAPMFLRRRHLKKRLMEVMKEVRMSTISKTRSSCVMCAAILSVGAACWLATGAFPLSAAPQTVDDATGVAVNLNGWQLMHRSPVQYPAEALAKGIEGTVVVQVKLDANGEVSDAAVLSGPDELRKAVLQSVLTWHFERTEALATRTVNIDFVKPAVAAPAARQAAPQLAQLPRPAGVPQFAPPPPPPPPPPVSGKLDQIVVTGLSDSARAELLAVLPIKPGDEWSGEAFAAARAAALKFDSHLTVGIARSSSGELSLRIGLSNATISTSPSPTFMSNNTVSPVGQGSGFGAGVGVGTGIGAGIGSGATVNYAAAPPPSGIFSVGNGTTAPVLITKVDPQFPAGAPAGFAGSVTLSIVVGTEGKAENIQIVKSLDPTFDVNAINAVQQWMFRPGMNNGVPVKVRANVEVNFHKL